MLRKMSDRAIKKGTERKRKRKKGKGRTRKGKKRKREKYMLVRKYELNECIYSFVFPKRKYELTRFCILSMPIYILGV